MYDLALDHALSLLGRNEAVSLDKLYYLFGDAAHRAADDLVYEGIASKTCDGSECFLVCSVREEDAQPNS